MDVRERQKVFRKAVRAVRSASAKHRYYCTNQHLMTPHKLQALANRVIGPVSSVWAKAYSTDKNWKGLSDREVLVANRALDLDRMYTALTHRAAENIVPHDNWVWDMTTFLDDVVLLEDVRFLIAAKDL